MKKQNKKNYSKKYGGVVLSVLAIIGFLGLCLQDQEPEFIVKENRCWNETQITCTGVPGCIIMNNKEHCWNDTIDYLDDKPLYLINGSWNCKTTDFFCKPVEVDEIEIVCFDKTGTHISGSMDLYLTSKEISKERYHCYYLKKEDLTTEWLDENADSFCCDGLCVHKSSGSNISSIDFKDCNNRYFKLNEYEIEVK